MSIGKVAGTPEIPKNLLMQSEIARAQALYNEVQKDSKLFYDEQHKALESINKLLEIRKSELKIIENLIQKINTLTQHPAFLNFEKEVYLEKDLQHNIDAVTKIAAEAISIQAQLDQVLQIFRSFNDGSWQLLGQMHWRIQNLYVNTRESKIEKNEKINNIIEKYKQQLDYCNDRAAELKNQEIKREGFIAVIKNFIQKAAALKKFYEKIDPYFSELEDIKQYFIDQYSDQFQVTAKKYQYGFLRYSEEVLHEDELNIFNQFFEKDSKHKVWFLKKNITEAAVDKVLQGTGKEYLKALFLRAYSRKNEWLYGKTKKVAEALAFQKFELHRAGTHARIYFKPIDGKLKNSFDGTTLDEISAQIIEHNPHWRISHLLYKQGSVVVELVRKDSQLPDIIPEKKVFSGIESYLNFVGGQLTKTTGGFNEPFGHNKKNSDLHFIDSQGKLGTVSVKQTPYYNVGWDYCPVGTDHVKAPFDIKILDVKYAGARSKYGLQIFGEILNYQVLYQNKPQRVFIAFSHLFIGHYTAIEGSVLKKGDLLAIMGNSGDYEMAKHVDCQIRLIPEDDIEKYSIKEILTSSRLYSYLVVHPHHFEDVAPGQEKIKGVLKVKHNK